MIRIRTSVLSGDQTCSSCKMHSWMVRRTCRGINVLASTWECCLVGLCGLIVCVTHHHYIDSLSFTIFQGNMSIMIKKMCFVDVHDGCWLIEVVLINMLSCHRQHVQQYRVCITLWSFDAHSTSSQFVHWVISCDEEWWPCLVSFHVMEQIHDTNDQHMWLKLGPNLVLSEVSLSKDVSLLL